MSTELTHYEQWIPAFQAIIDTAGKYDATGYNVKFAFFRPAPDEFIDLIIARDGSGFGYHIQGNYFDDDSSERSYLSPKHAVEALEKVNGFLNTWTPENLRRGFIDSFSSYLGKAHAEKERKKLEELIRSP